MTVSFFQMQFYGPDKFCRYNMFNNYFFDGEKNQDTFKQFINGKDADKIVMVTDPPFGGLVEVLAHTVKTISQTWQENQGIDYYNYITLCTSLY